LVQFLDTDRQVATVVMETSQLVLSQFKNFFNVIELTIKTNSKCVNW